MGNIAPPPSGGNAPPRYEEFIRKVDGSNAPVAVNCLCHRANPAIREAIEELAEKYSKRKSTLFHEWEYGRIKSMLGIVRAPSFVCDLKEIGNCRCHSEYALLEGQIKGYETRLWKLTMIYREDRKNGVRSEEDMLSWARHKGDIWFLHRMLRNCKGEGQASSAQQAENEELKRKLEALEERIDKLFLK